MIKRRDYLKDDLREILESDLGNVFHADRALMRAEIIAQTGSLVRVGHREDLVGMRKRFLALDLLNPVGGHEYHEIRCFFPRQLQILTTYLINVFVFFDRSFSHSLTPFSSLFR